MVSRIETLKELLKNKWWFSEKSEVLNVKACILDEPKEIREYLIEYQNLYGAELHAQRTGIIFIIFIYPYYIIYGPWAFYDWPRV